MFCVKCGKELSEGNAFCGFCGTKVLVNKTDIEPSFPQASSTYSGYGTTMNPTPPSPPARSAIHPIVNSVTTNTNKDTMRFVSVGLAVVCALLLIQCFAGLSSISVTEEEWAQSYRERTVEKLVPFIEISSVILPAAQTFGLTGFCGLAFSALAVSRKMSDSKKLLRFSFIISALMGLVSLLLVVARAATGIGVQETLTPISVGILMCSIAGLIIMGCRLGFLSYQDDTSKPPVSGVLIALVFFLGMGLLQYICRIFSQVSVGMYLGTIALATINTLSMESGDIAWTYFGWSLILCSITGFAMRGRLLRFGLPTCLGVGASVSIVRVVNYYSGLHSSIMQLENDSELLGMVRLFEHFPPVQISLFHCLLALFIHKAVSEQIRFRTAIITPIVFAMLQFLLTLILIPIFGFGIAGAYYAQILATAISIIIVCFLRTPRAKR